MNSLEQSLRQRHFQTEIRKIILEQSRRVNVGHIGSALSIVEILIAVYTGGLDIKNPSLKKNNSSAKDLTDVDLTDLQEDKFILSKGHAGLALYAIFGALGWISEATLNTYFSDNSLLGVHPESGLSGVEFSVGSLGQGMTFAVGLALAMKLRKSERKVCVLISDAECNEGSVWEAVMFAAQHKLSNLIVIIDNNKQQAFGYTKDIISLQYLQEKWHSFGWNAIEVDGHDVASIETALKQNQQNEVLTLDHASCEKPKVIIADTIFGKGVSYMEQKIAWHYLPMNEEQFQQALSEI